MPVPPIQPPEHNPYQRLFELIRIHIPEDLLKAVSKYDVAAVAIQESMGVAFFCTCDSLYKQNLLALSVGSGCDQRRFINYITVQNGASKGEIPKFRFEASWFRLVNHDDKTKDFPLEKRALYSCSIGIGQQSLYYLMKAHQHDDFETFLDNFISSEGMQLRQLLYVLQGEVSGAKGDKALAFTRYNQGHSARHVSDYGTRVLALSNRLKQLKEKN